MKSTTNVDPPLRVAWTQAIASIRVRFLRMAITTLGIALGIAFFCSMQTLRIAESTVVGSERDRQAWLIATSLLMCLVGVTNSMLMSVGERFREIGTIKCLGASDGFVVKIFVLEALLLGLIGSSVGATLGTVAIAVFATRAGETVTLPQVATTIGVGVAAGALLTITAAVVPAMQAARMPAAAALRVEL